MALKTILYIRITIYIYIYLILYILSDAERAAFKAEAAAEALRRIAPPSLISASAVVLGIPIPGHPEHWRDEKLLCEAVAQLSTLIAQHDAVFSVLDSREARWLPTLLCAAEDKLLITAALGMESYLVMRSGSELGCYYCSDVCGVGNSQRARAADQQCTVTRPGGSMVAAALAVELLVQ
jgi:ubiquitin-like modifier-activating enzyme ATG7